MSSFKLMVTATLFGWVLASATALADDPAAVIRAAEPPIIHIDLALYGAALGSTGCDAKPAVEPRCHGRFRCIVEVGDALCMGETLLNPPLIRALTVSYHCGSNPRGYTIRAESPMRMLVSCRS